MGKGQSSDVRRSLMTVALLVLCSYSSCYEVVLGVECRLFRCIAAAGLGHGGEKVGCEEDSEQTRPSY